MQYFERGQCYWLYFDKVQCNGNCSWENTRNFTAPMKILDSHSSREYTQWEKITCIYLSPLLQVNACTKFWKSVHFGQHYEEVQMHRGFFFGRTPDIQFNSPTSHPITKKYLLVLFCISMSPVPQVNACTELWWSAHPGKHSGEAQLLWGGERSPTIVHHICHPGVLSNQIWGSDISCLCPLNLHWSCSGQ